MGKQEPILRDAETKDMKSIIYLTEKLIDCETEMSDIPIIEDVQERKKIVMEMIARSLVDPDHKVWVVEKSGRILGVFIAEKKTRFTIESRNPICVFSHAYSQKTVLSFYEIHNKVKNWAREQGCKAIQMTGLIGNTKIQKLVESLGYNKIAIIYEMEV